jgi:hypothetical protein
MLCLKLIASSARQNEVTQSVRAAIIDGDTVIHLHGFQQKSLAAVVALALLVPIRPLAPTLEGPLTDLNITPAPGVVLGANGSGALP